ncbi:MULTISPECIES: hypothetical protein [unclassified Novosphingobium]|uniref:hypothetical protein n=1 Tax=unclassified Novosphingobium TaxID=2644732 RepID=UPI00146B878F|nr:MULTISPECIES: hypothetical protein [unclassified Novosphingobium]NMN03815.1 hypothetical protein [Novosphingobium sp. SG919]NMN86195.1 hypothetical protein [Novosphingobium sp. SG916]
MNAQSVFDAVPLGSLVRFSNGEPRPPARFSRKLKAWNNDNGVGRLVAREPARDGASFRHPASFTLHLGNYGSEGSIIMVVRRTYSVDSSLEFEVDEYPRPGDAHVLASGSGRDELLHIASDRAAAERWLAANRYTQARIEIVGSGPQAGPNRSGL